MSEAAAGPLRVLGKVPVNVARIVPRLLAKGQQHAIIRKEFAHIDAGLASPA